MNIRFSKMHGLGNDYVYIDVIDQPDVLSLPDLPALARSMSDRHTGVGSDGIILIAKPEPGVDAHVRMRMFNADGSESEMCGNGVRCVAKFAHDRLGFREAPIRVQTGRGVLAISFAAEGGLLTSATVDMGEPILELVRVPVLREHLDEPEQDASNAGPEWSLRVRGASPSDRLQAVFVSMGNPHAVFFDQPMDLARLGPVIEHHPAFPNRINVHAVRVRSRTHAEMTPWERGAGFTRACGTGACAVLVAGVLTGRLDREATITLPGGDLRVRWEQKSGRVLMTGPATHVYDGTWATQPERPDLPVLTTRRLTLRPLAPGDAAAIQRLADNPRVSANLLTMPSPYTIPDAHRFIAMNQRSVHSGAWVNWALTRRPAGGEEEFLGVLGLRLERNQDRAEVGYWLGEAYWGQGLMPEAVRAVAGWAFANLGLNKLWAGRFAENPASGRVLEKAGFTLEGTLRGHLKRQGTYRDDVVYGLLRSEWTP
jgi:diaminopimelate epimerase